MFCRGGSAEAGPSGQDYFGFEISDFGFFYRGRDMLADLIHLHAAVAAVAGDFAAVAQTLNAATIERTSEGQKRSLGDVLTLLGAADSEKTLTALDLSQVGRSGRAKLEADGLDFSHHLTVGLIMQLHAAKALPAGVAAKLLGLGRWTVSPAADRGLQPVTEAECREAWQADRLRSQWTNIQNEIINPAASNRTTLRDALRKAADMLEAT